MNVHGSIEVSQSHNNFSEKQQLHYEVEDDEEEVEIPNESKISKTLSERTTKIVIILVLCMLFILPVFQPDTYGTDTTSHQQALYFISDVYESKDWPTY